MLATLHSVIDREEQESISSCHYVEIRKIHSWQSAPPGSISHGEKVEASFSELSNILKNI